MTDVDRTRVRTMWVDDGLSAGLIAKRLGVTRGVVANILRRMNLFGARPNVMNRSNHHHGRSRSLGGLGNGRAINKPPTFLEKWVQRAPPAPSELSLYQAQVPDDVKACRRIVGDLHAGGFWCGKATIRKNGTSAWCKDCNADVYREGTALGSKSIKPLWLGRAR